MSVYPIPRKNPIPGIKNWDFRDFLEIFQDFRDFALGIFSGFSNPVLDPRDFGIFGIFDLKIKNPIPKKSHPEAISEGRPKQIDSNNFKISTKLKEHCFFSKINFLPGRERLDFG